ncbi:type I-E CRISPR-associated protein Cse2/CasB [Streptomyces lydicamycinicus]|uniref:type I-E CRISPR-associated protein Cse2/CasB n=1 Tax=Streptomyces lydicamycinicus TaxID=1546107 RepID=UPI003C2F2FE5
MTTTPLPTNPQQTGTGPGAAGPSAWLTEAREFVRAISQMVAKDTGAKAALRSGVGKSLDDVPRMHRIVAPRLPATVARDADSQLAFYAVAALIAAHHRRGPSEPEAAPLPARGRGDSTDEQSADNGGGIPEQRAARRAEAEQQRRERFGDTLGLAFATAVARGAHKGIRESAAETRLNLLCKQSSAGLHRHLPAAVRQLCDRGAPPDWARLLVDLRNWPQQRRRIARWWLQDYYRARAAADLAGAREADNEAQHTATTPASTD